MTAFIILGFVICIAAALYLTLGTKPEDPET